MTISVPLANDINAFLENLGADFRVKPLGNGQKFFWLHHVGNAYAFKTDTEFIIRLGQVLSPETTDVWDALSDLFSMFPSAVRSPFVVYEKTGFVAKDYAEFYVTYGPVDDQVMTDSEIVVGPEMYYVDETCVEVSYSSSILHLLNARYEDDSLFDINQFPTIKLKGTSADSVEDDLCAALYYLGVLSPSIYSDTPRVARLVNEDDIFTGEPEEPESSKTHLRKPSHPAALRFFYQAELTSGDAALLYYYKTLEYLFDEAWRQRIVELIAEYQDTPARLAEALASEQPRNETMYLGAVLRAVESDHMWTTVSRYGFPHRDIESLAGSVYAARNRVAHGKDSAKLDLLLPSIISDSDLSRHLSLLKFLAREALFELCGIDRVRI